MFSKLKGKENLSLWLTRMFLFGMSTYKFL